VSAAALMFTLPSLPPLRHHRPGHAANVCPRPGGSVRQGVVCDSLWTFKIVPDALL